MPESPHHSPLSGLARLAPEPVAVLGYGVEGKSTVRHLLRAGCRDITVLDRTEPADALPEGVRGVFGPDCLQTLARARTAFRSPGWRPFAPEFDAFVARGGSLTSQVEAAFSLLGRERIVGVTGTVGKGTCCSLLSAMLDRGGVAHRLAGNIGLPPLDALEDLPPGARLLLELSSFQLATMRESPSLAVVLRVTSEHLDWHATRDEYWNHKANLVRFQERGDTCVVFTDTEGSAWMGTLGAGEKIPVGARGTIRIAGNTVAWPEHGLRIDLAETRMAGAFNLENIAAAAAAALVLGVSAEAAAAAARAFAPLEHRLEFVREANGVRYYNDSYATRPEAALAAARALHDAPLGLILGGSEKFADFGELAAGLAACDHLRAVAFIGQTAERLEDALRVSGTLDAAKRAWRRCATLEEAVGFLRGEIREGAILLSPACASFGLFTDYKARGRTFKELVKRLA